MNQFLRQLTSLVIFGLMLFVLLHVGFFLIGALLIVGLCAFIWYGWKFFLLRKNIEAALRQHREEAGDNPSYSYRQNTTRVDEKANVIEGEFYEVNKKE